MFGLGRRCPSTHVLSSFSAQGLECYNCLGVSLGIACKSITCPYPDAVCISQQVELIVGKFPVTYIKMAEEGFGENVMSGYLLWTRVPLLQIELFWSCSGTPEKWGLLGIIDVLGCGSSNRAAHCHAQCSSSPLVTSAVT